MGRLFWSRKKIALEIQSKIAATDEDIDQMVYKLYGLSKEEILVIDGK